MHDQKTASSITACRITSNQSMLAMSYSSHKRYDKYIQARSRNELAATAPGAACTECAGPTEVTTLTSMHSQLPSVHILLAFCRMPVCHTFRTYCSPSKSTYASLPTGRSPTSTDTSSQKCPLSLHLHSSLTFKITNISQILDSDWKSRYAWHLVFKLLDRFRAPTVLVVHFLDLHQLRASQRQNLAYIARRVSQQLLRQTDVSQQPEVALQLQPVRASPHWDSLW